MKTVYGVVFSGDGLAAKQVLAQGALRPELRQQSWATPSAAIRGTQPSRIIVDQEHDHQAVGEVIHLERRGDNIWAVATVQDWVTPSVSVRVAERSVSVPHPLFWSAEHIGTADFAGVEILALSLTTSPARIGARTQPVKFVDGDPHMAAYTSSDSFQRGLLERAHQAQLTRHGGPIVVHEETPSPRHLPWDGRSDYRPAIEIRSAPELVDVKERTRTIDLIVLPYERETYVEHHGRMIGEIIDRAAFVGCEHDVNRVRVNRDHVRERTCGKALLLDPGHPSGLFASLRIAKTPLGDETLQLAEEGILDASAGFGCLSGGEKWETRSRRRVTRGFLDHIAMTPAPAYEDAKVLAVRADHALR